MIALTVMASSSQDVDTVPAWIHTVMKGKAIAYNEGESMVYSCVQFKRDLLYLLDLLPLLVDGHWPDCACLLLPGDVDLATSVTACMNDAKKNEYSIKILDAIIWDSHIAAKGAVVFKAFL